MKRVFRLLGSTIIAATGMLSLKAQNVGIGTANPVEKLDVNGGIRIGQSNNTVAGTIRWNAVKSDFEGYNGVSWVSLTGGVSKWGNQASYSTESSATYLYLYGHTNEKGTELGCSVQASGDWFAAGAYRDADFGDATKYDVGSVRIFRRSGDNWALKYNLISPHRNSNDFFGGSVGISPTHIIAGAYYADLPGKNNAGKVFIYRYDSSNVAIQDTLTASESQAEDWFGRAVAIYADYAAVGAPGNDVGGISNMGRAYVFRRYGNSWPQMSLITPPDGAEGDGYGSSIALWQDYLAVGAPYKDVNGIYNGGKVYVYRQSGSGWGLIAQIPAPAPRSGTYFGKGLAIQDGWLVIGAPDQKGVNQEIPGSAYVYSIDNNTVSLHATLTASDAQGGDIFGESVVVKDNVILVGAPGASVGAANWHGKAYPFQLVNGQWQQQAILTSSTNAMGDRFGQSVALAPGFGIVGAPLADMPYCPDNGMIFFFKR